MKTSQEEEEEALAPPRNRSIAIDRSPRPRGQSPSPRPPRCGILSSLREHIQIETFSILESFVINTQSHIELHRKE